MAYSAFPFAFTHRSPPAWLPSSHKADIQRLPWPFSSTWTNSQIACMPHAKSHLHLPSEPSIPFAHASSRLLHGHCPQTTTTLNCLASTGPYHHIVHVNSFHHLHTMTAPAYYRAPSSLHVCLSQPSYVYSTGLHRRTCCLHYRAPMQFQQ